MACIQEQFVTNDGACTVHNASHFSILNREIVQPLIDKGTHSYS